MKFNETIGIDVSKHTIDISIHTEKKHKCFKNDKDGFKSMLKWIKTYSTKSFDETLFAFEHTGLYSLPLSVFLTELNIPYILIPGLELKRSMGIARGKDDKIDSQNIALYAYRRREELTPYQLPSKNLLQIRRLLSLRERMVKQCAGYKATLREMKRAISWDDNTLYFEINENLINDLSEQIQKVEKELLRVIREDGELKRLYRLIISIKGVGMHTAFYMIAFTNGFTLFENARKFASYAGIAPFPYKSGISISGRNKIHPFANKKFKSLLGNCATNAVIYNTEMRLFYERRIKEGKNKMSTMNIVRNKILGRIFAVVQRGEVYVDTFAYASR